jgi:hypothetical protein
MVAHNLLALAEQVAQHVLGTVVQLLALEVTVLVPVVHQLRVVLDV